MATYTLISSNILGVQTTSVTFSSIPATYTDLVLKASTRSSAASNLSAYNVTFNGSSAGYNTIYLNGNGASVASNAFNSAAYFEMPYGNGDGATANSFASFDLYISNYLSSSYKQSFPDFCGEGNTTTAYRTIESINWSNTSAITSITIQPKVNDWLAGSSFYLYGIKNS